MALASGFITIKDFNDVIIANSAPLSPVLDQLWFDTGIIPPALKRWSGSTWVSSNITPSEYTDLLAITNGSSKFKTSGAPTNDPSPVSVSITTNTNSTINIKLSFGAYVQGAIPADYLVVYWNKTSTKPTKTDSSTNIPIDAISYIFEGVNPADTYSFGIAAARKSATGLEIGDIVSCEGYTATFARSSVAYKQDGSQVASGVPRYEDIVFSGNAMFTRATEAYKQDGTQVSSGTPRYERGRAQVLTQEGTINLLANPSFESDWTSWAFGLGTGITATRTIVNSPVKSGTKAAKVEITASTTTADASLKQQVPVAEGVPITLSAEILEISGNVQVKVNIQAYNGTTYRNVGSGDVTTTGRISCTDTLPAGYWIYSLWVQVTPRSIGNTGYVIIDDVQFEQKPAATPFVNGARADVYSNTSDSTIFIEEGTSNLMLTPFDALSSSCAFNPAAIDSTRSSNTVIAPDGTLTADTLYFGPTYGSSDKFGAWASSQTWVSGDKYTFSVWLRADSAVSLTIGAGRTSSNPGISKTIVVTTVWQRFSITYTTDNSTTGTIYGDLAGSSITIHVWGFQIEKKAYPTSFHPTTRNNEVLTIPTAGVLDLVQGSIECWVNLSSNSQLTTAYQYVAYANNGTDTIRIMHTPGSKWYFSTCNASGESNIIINDLSIGWHHFAMTWSSSKLSAYVDGVLVGFVNTPKLPSSIGPIINIGTSNINALFDNLRISKYELTATEIASNYNSNLPCTQNQNQTVFRFNNSLSANNLGKGIVIEESTSNLYADGDYATGSLHPMRNAAGWSIVTDPTGRWSGNVAKFTANSNPAYMGRDVTITIGQVYTISVWCYVSIDFVAATPVRLECEQGISGGTPYNLNAKGTWQYLTYTPLSATTTNGRVLAYPGYDNGSALPSAGYVLFKNMQVEQKAYATSFHAGTRNAEDLYIPSTGTLSPTQGTIEFWFKPYEITSLGYLLGPYNNPAIFHATKNGNNLTVSAISNQGTTMSVNAGAIFSINKGIVIAITWGQGGLSVYVDGVLKGNASGSPNIIFPTSFYIGSQPNGYQTNGLISNFRVFNTELTATDILDLYNTGLIV